MKHEMIVELSKGKLIAFDKVIEISCMVRNETNNRLLIVYYINQYKNEQQFYYYD